MNASYEWLRDFVPFGLSPEQLRDLLTSRVATVDDIIRLRADLAEVVVARVVEVDRHPNADHLWVTKVDAGSGELRDVVCGAPNVVAGALYPFAPVGSTLPGGVKLEKRKIRGSVSEGMLCSARELGLGTDHEGIMALDVDVSPGTKFLDAMPVGDVRLVVDVLPNRPDLLSHEGLAREIAAATRIPLETPVIRHSSPAVGETSREAASVNVSVDDVVGCPRYMAAIVRGVKVGPSPAWLVSRIEAVGSRSINNVVDATNYMLHGFGQPMHAFDVSRLDGSQIVVRRARPGEKVRTLDGVDRTLDGEMTVIADANKAQAIAGVIGGEGSEVTEVTTDILLEVASFEPRRVRATRGKLGVMTDASYRFERGVDAHACQRHLAYAVDLILAVAGGRLAGVKDVSTKLESPPAIHVRTKRVTALLGEAIDAAEVDRELSSIGFSVATGKRDEGLSVTPPTWRSDVVAEVEVIEEIARLHGYDKFSSEIRPFRPGSVPDAPLHVLSARVRNACVAQGLLEVRPLPFTRRNDERSLKVRNPLAEDEAFLRQDILDTLARRAEFNLAHMQRTIRLFEIGAVFAARDARDEALSDGGLPDERIHLAILVMGDRRPPHFTEPRPPHYDEWDAKGLAESLGEAAFPGHVISCVTAEEDVLWTITAADVRVGIVRRVPLDAPAWAAPAFGIEIDLEALSPLPGRMYSAKPGESDRPAKGVEEAMSNQTGGAIASTTRMYQPIPAMPSMDIDLALIVSDRIRSAQVEEVVRRSAGELLERLVLFDEFRGAGIPAGSRSLAWRLTFRHPERTLREREIQGRTERIVKALEGELGVRQRTA